MFKHYLSTAWRNFLRHKVSTIISVFGLSLGLACFISAVGAITYLNGADRHIPDSDRVVAIMERRTSKEFDFDTGFIHHSSEGLANSIRKEFPELTAVTTIGGRIGSRPVKVDGREAIIDIGVVDRDFLSVLNWPRLRSVAEDPLAVPMGVVLSEETARQLFGTVDALGSTVQLDGDANLTVAAVLKSFPRQSHVGSHTASVYNIEALVDTATAATLERMATGREPRARSLEDQWSFSMGFFTYAKLSDSSPLGGQAFEQRLSGIAERNGAGKDWEHTFRVVPLSKAWLASIELNFLPFESSISITATLLVIAGLVLGVACANYATLAFAQALRRTKESGVRRIVGATRAQVGAQAIVEAACHVVVALAIAVVIVEIVGIVLNNRTGIDALGAIRESAVFWSSIAAMALTVSVIAGLYPAFILTRLRPSQIVRTGSAVSIKGRGAWVLLGTQFAITGVLLAILLVVYQQNLLSRSKAFSSLANEQIYLGSKWSSSRLPLQTWRTELLRSPAIKSVSATSNRPWTADFGFYPFVLTGRSGTVSPVSMAVQYDFEKVLNLNVRAGRTFGPSYHDVEFGGKGQPSIVIDETLSAALGFKQPQDAVDQVLQRHDETGSVRIIGVITDQPLRLLPFLDRTGNAYQLFPGMASTPIVRVDGTRLPEALKAIDQTWKQLNPTEPVDRKFFDDSFEQAYAIYDGISRVLSAITAITLLIAVLGGFGFANFIAGRRAHEIGVRKTLGAHTSQVVAMLLKDFSKPVLIANIVVWPLAYLGAQQYLSMFVQRIDLTLWPFVLSLILTVLISSIAVSNRAYRAARVGPADVLRHE